MTHKTVKSRLSEALDELEQLTYQTTLLSIVVQQCELPEDKDSIKRIEILTTTYLQQISPLVENIDYYLGDIIQMLDKSDLGVSLAD